MSVRNKARYLRLAVIRNLLGSNNLTREEALELLNAPLNPDDPSTMSDDRELIDISVEDFKALYNKELEEEQSSKEEG